jgi:hypothetical protein
LVLTGILPDWAHDEAAYYLKVMYTPYHW